MVSSTIQFKIQYSYGFLILLEMRGWDKIMRGVGGSMWTLLIRWLVQRCLEWKLVMSILKDGCSLSNEEESHNSRLCFKVIVPNNLDWKFSIISFERSPFTASCFQLMTALNSWPKILRFQVENNFVTVTKRNFNLLVTTSI